MEENSVSCNLQFTDLAKSHLKAVSKWVSIISIIGLTVIIIAIITSVYDYIVISKIDDVPSGGGVGYFMISFMTYFLFLASVFCFLPMYFLYKFSSCLKMALENDDSDSLEISFRYLKFHYISIGVLPLCIFVYFLVVSIF
ncbi:hypothetical protein [Flavobacterium reichenbachii]|uniref:Uncharacterized protein n=1 Tax=Flavobacterium reichenbachii TaxID=362418 RepID=A0A085ZL64_9FLAO|nr:hypothetical protein [Flavobacterium reichenbachii]KFF05178.1 hypothetical protein IW19_06360 [Flavobacterium reichenbachii]OXB16159.1 hypothetical protein B0A68_07795 [Flavobacterium reichenbachii]